MKKSSYIALVMGTVSAMMFSLGMCMVLLPEWNSVQPGMIFGSIGLALGLITVLVWRKMEGKAPVQISGKNLLVIAVGIAGALLLGIGMCLCMVWNRMLAGIILGMTGIAALLGLIPLVKGFQD